jgi:hypothetical protein
LREENFLAAKKEIIDEIFLNIPDVKSKKMFGHAGYFVNGKLVAFHYKEGIVVKVPQDLYELLISSKEHKSGPFKPLNKGTGKNWIHIARENPEDFQKDYDIFGAAVEYVNNLENEKK